MNEGAGCLQEGRGPEQGSVWEKGHGLNEEVPGWLEESRGTVDGNWISRRLRTQTEQGSMCRMSDNYVQSYYIIKVKHMALCLHISGMQ